MEADADVVGVLAHSVQVMLVELIPFEAGKQQKLVSIILCECNAVAVCIQLITFEINFECIEIEIQIVVFKLRV